MEKQEEIKEYNLEISMIQEISIIMVRILSIQYLRIMQL
jgi:hypothetical protein